MPTTFAIEDDADVRFDSLGLDLALPDEPSAPHPRIEAVYDGLAFGVDDSEGLAGFVFGSVVGDAVFVEEVSVRTRAAGQRIGSRLIERLDAAARELGLRELVLTTFRDVPWNAPYYRRLGFTEGAGSRGAALLSAEVNRGMDEDQRVAMKRPVLAVGEDGTHVFTTGEHPTLLDDCRALMDRAFVDEEGVPDFDDTDWDHALGGLHAVVTRNGAVLAHASVVRRVLWLGGQRREAGYIEAVAVEPEVQGQGLGTRVMRALQSRMRSAGPLGPLDVLALSTGQGAFYERLGWRQWQGPTFVMRDGQPERTPDDDGGIYVLEALRPIDDLGGSIGCEARSGDVW